jgi:hypothetical protein
MEQLRHLVERQPDGIAIKGCVVVVRKFIAERIITYLAGMKNRDFHLQIEILGLQTGFSACYLPCTNNILYFHIFYWII